jgi:hypothetical protein
MTTLSRRSWLAHATCASLAACAPAAAGASSRSETGFQISYVAGGRDAAGRFMGGTEIRVLAAHQGKLFAGNGYWEDQPGWEGPQGAQILVLDRPDGAWAVDHDFDARQLNGRPRHLATSALRDVMFRTSSTGTALKQSVSFLLASTWDLTGTRTVFARDAATGQWSGSALAQSPQTKDFTPHIRAFGQHRDAVTGADLAFAGDPSGIFSGA